MLTTVPGPGAASVSKADSGCSPVGSVGVGQWAGRAVWAIIWSWGVSVCAAVSEWTGVSVCALEATLGGQGHGHQEGQGPLDRWEGWCEVMWLPWGGTGGPGFLLAEDSRGLCVSLASVVGGCPASLVRMERAGVAVGPGSVTSSFCTMCEGSLRAPMATMASALSGCAPPNPHPA